MQLLRLLLPLSLLAFVTAAGAAQHGQAGRDDPKVGDSVSGVLAVRSFNVPLPEGAWSVYFVAANDDDSHPRLDVGLALVQAGVVKQTAYVVVARAPGRDGFKRYANCERPHYLHTQVSINRHGLDQACWHVRPIDLGLSDRPPDALGALSKFADEAGIYLPVVLLGARFHNADRTGALRVAYNWNPDLIVSAGQKKKFWIYADWTNDGIALDPRKAAVVAIVRSWAEEWLPSIEAAFVGRTKAAE